MPIISGSNIYTWNKKIRKKMTTSNIGFTIYDNYYNNIFIDFIQINILAKKIIG